MPKFERKTKEERCREIIEAAKKVFLKKGYRNTTMEDIVAATSLSKGGLYQYYKNTKAIMFDIMQSGNSSRYSRSQEIIQAGLKNGSDVCEIITQAAMAKLFDTVPEKKLYLMFFSEIVYDKASEELHRKLEKQAFELLLQNLEVYKERFPYADRIRRKLENADVLFYSRLCIGIMTVYELFSDKEVFEDRRSEIHDIVYSFVRKFLM